MSLTKLSLAGKKTKLFPPRKSLISDIPAWDGKTANSFLQCTWNVRCKYSAQKCGNKLTGAIIHGTRVWWVECVGNIYSMNTQWVNKGRMSCGKLPVYGDHMKILDWEVCIWKRCSHKINKKLNGKQTSSITFLFPNQISSFSFARSKEAISAS
jgi:hypothetical protein